MAAERASVARNALAARAGERRDPRGAGENIGRAGKAVMGYLAFAGRPSRTSQSGAHPGRTRGRSFDDLIGAEQDHRWQDDTEGFRGLLVDDEADPGRLLNRQVAGPGALEDPVDVPCALPEHREDISAVLQEAPTLGKAGDLQMAGSRCRAARPITRSV